MLRKFIIEREIPGVGKLTPEELRGASQRSNKALAEVGPGVQWIQSYLTADKTFCVYLAESEEFIRKHALKSGFPATKITEVKTIFDPATGG